MSNEFIMLLEIVVVFSIVLLSHKFFGENGLMAWMAVASCIAQIGAAKTVSILGMGTSAGSVLFASTFLVTDILAECYGRKAAKKAVFVGLASVLSFVIATTFINVMAPAPADHANDAVAALFGLVPRISIASIVMYFIANMADVFIYSKSKEKTGNRFMWLRNNISTILCNGAENFFFFGLAFAGIQPWNVIFELALSTTIVETIIAVCDTPFLYLATKIGRNKERSRTDMSTGNLEPEA